jgi:hypothetical protein
MSDFFSMILVTALAVGATWFFADQSVTPADMEWASRSCDPNGGVKSLFADIDALEVRCANGAVFTTDKKALQGAQP